MGRCHTPQAIQRGIRDTAAPPPYQTPGRFCNIPQTCHAAVHCDIWGFRYVMYFVAHSVTQTVIAYTHHQRPTTAAPQTQLQRATATRIWTSQIYSTQDFSRSWILRVSRTSLSTWICTMIQIHWLWRKWNSWRLILMILNKFIII